MIFGMRKRCYYIFRKIYKYIIYTEWLELIVEKLDVVVLRIKDVIRNRLGQERNQSRDVELGQENVGIINVIRRNRYDFIFFQK